MWEVLKGKQLEAVRKLHCHGKLPIVNFFNSKSSNRFFQFFSSTFQVIEITCFVSPDKNISFDKSIYYVATQLSDWKNAEKTDCMFADFTFSWENKLCMEYLYFELYDLHR